MRVIVFTGSRALRSLEALRNVEATLAECVRAGDAIFVGDCPTGLDRIVRSYCEAVGYAPHVFEADWDTHGPAAARTTA